MTKNHKDEREALARLAAELADDILKMTDEELVAELLEEGRNPTDEANAMRAVIERAARTTGKARLAAAKAEINASLAGQSSQRSSLDALGARRKLRVFLASGVAHGVSMAARNESEMSDSDVFSMLADLEDLGIISDDKNPDVES